MAIEADIIRKRGCGSLPDFNQQLAARKTIELGLVLPTYQKLLRNITRKKYSYPRERFGQRGIVVCAGGNRYFPCAWVLINMLRKLNCALPIQLWYLGEKEMNLEMRTFMEEVGVECVDALKVRTKYPSRKLGGWELKPYSIINSRFEEVLYLDADNLAVKNPEYLFETVEYKTAGVVLWPDFGRCSPKRLIWKICEVEYRNEPEVESGQILINKSKCWHALQIAMHLNEHSDFYYKYIHGDKETFHMAFRRLNQTYAMPYRGIAKLSGVMCQHDFDGNRLFQHRNMDKWNLIDINKDIKGFLYQSECQQFVDQLRDKWNSYRNKYQYCGAKSCEAVKLCAEALTSHDYNRSSLEEIDRKISFLRDGTIGVGASREEMFWNIEEKAGKIILHLASERKINCSLVSKGDGVWNGHLQKSKHSKVNLVAHDKIKS
jgi:hypothetical protein